MTGIEGLAPIPAPWRIPVKTARPGSIEAIHYTDAGCPWAYNAEPAFRALEARYGDQLTFRTVMIGLSETRQGYVDRGYSDERSSLSRRSFRHRGMPMSTEPRKVTATAPACRLVKAAERQDAAFGEALVRQLRFAWFTTGLECDRDDALLAIAQTVQGLDAERALAERARPEVEHAYQADRAEARDPQRFAVTLNRTASSDGPDRYTAPSLVLRRNGRELVAPGYQPFEVYDVLVANLDPEIERLAPPDPLDLLHAYPGGLTTAEVTRVLAETTTDPNLAAAEDALIRLAVAGAIARAPLGHDALWTPISQTI